MFGPKLQGVYALCLYYQDHVTKLPMFVLLSHMANEVNVEVVRQRLLREIPNWVDFQVINIAKDLGTLMGPTSSSSQWAGQLANSSDRADRIDPDRLPHWLSVGSYSSRAVSGLSYVG